MTIDGPDNEANKAEAGGVAPAIASAAEMIAHDKPAFERFIDNWVDRRRHGGISRDKRPGYALRSGLLRGKAPGVLAPAYAWLAPEDVPDGPEGLKRFLTDLIACSERARATKDVQKAIEITLGKWSGSKEPYSLDQHVDALLKIRAMSVDLYTAAVLGDFPSAEPLVNAIIDESGRHHAKVVLARQRIVWSAFDVHRVAALGWNAAKALTPWFMRPFVRTGTANEYLTGLITIASTIDRIFSASDRAERYGREKVSVRGPRGIVLAPAEIMAAPLEARLSDSEKQAILDSRSVIRAQSDEYRKTFEKIAGDEGRNNQEGLFEWHFCLSEIGALFMTAYRFAEDEAAMLEVIRCPQNPAALFDVARRVHPRTVEQSLVTRARHLVAAYRPAVLMDIEARPYDPAEIIAAEVSEEKAKALLARLASANQLSLKEARAADFFDLSHHARADRT